jgi:hypothetical protein
MRLMVTGIQRDAIRQYTSQTWGASTRNTDRYIAAATALLAAAGKTDIEADKGQAIARYSDIYAKAQAKGWLKIAIMAQERIDEVQGLTGRFPVAVAIANGGGNGGMRPEDMDKIRDVVSMTMQSAAKESEARATKSEKGPVE